MWPWAWTWAYLEYFDDGDKIFLGSLCHIRMTWKIFFHMYMDEMFGWKIWQVEIYMDETNSKTIMSDENHMYMNDNYKKHEIFRWMWVGMNFWMIIGSKQIF